MKTWQERIIEAHTAVTDAVSHAERLSSERYFVWQEDGYNALLSDNVHSETSVTGFTDFFTKQEFDSWADELCRSFEKYEIAYDLRIIQYEEDTGYFHYTWDWEIA